MISELASKRSFNNFNYGGDIRTPTRWCAVLDCVSYSSCHGLPDHCAWQLGLQVMSSQNSSQRQAKLLLEQADSEAKGETTVLQNRMHPSQKNVLDLLGTHIYMPRCSKFFRENVGNVATGIQQR